MRFISYLSTTVILLFLALLRFGRSQDDSYYYDKCAPFTCGNVTVAFPFSSSETFCGLPGYEVACDPSASTPTITLSGIPYRINEIYRNASLLSVSDLTLIQGLRSNSCDQLRNHFLPNARLFTPLQIPYWGTTLNFSWCPGVDPLPSDFSQQAVRWGCVGNESLYVFPPSGTYNNDSKLPASCFHAAFPVQTTNLLRENNSISRDALLYYLVDGFPLQWNTTDCWDCEADCGRCGYNQSTRSFVCYRKSGCGAGGQGKGRSHSWKIIVATVVPSTCILLAAVAAIIKFRTGASSIFNLNIRSISRSDRINVGEFIRNYRSMLPSDYSYNDVKKITDGFREKLGTGGYGNVFKGKLPNGQLIAAKILEKSKDDGRDFVNEVATIGRIHHVNIIRLLGFCCDGSRRALIYEFMQRGSLGDLIFKEDIRQMLGMPKLLEIAIGIAQGIEYLHQGCERRILHLDIKPHNVLLDHSFHPKISDFGLARSFSRKDSAVELTGARGTVGYIAPEMFMRNLGGVSHKSDVYSYGMLLLELAIGRKNFKPENEQSSGDGYFPDWIYDQLNQWRQTEMDELVVEEDTTISRKMVMVGLWCIQSYPVDRPSISTALGMLTGRIECHMPPKPFLFSPPRTQSFHIDNNSESVPCTAESEYSQKQAASSFLGRRELNQ